MCMFMYVCATPQVRTTPKQGGSHLQGVPINKNMRICIHAYMYAYSCVVVYTMALHVCACSCIGVCMFMYVCVCATPNICVWSAL